MKCLRFIAPASFLLVCGVFSLAEAWPIRGVYLGSNKIDSGKRVDEIFELLDSVEVNAVVVDFKDDGGALLSREQNKKLLVKLKEKGAYVICRVVTFKDDAFARSNPDAALKKKSDPEKLWSDHKGSHWLDPAHPKAAEHIVSVAGEGAVAGCNEINFDYIRFPSALDGDLKNAAYPSGSYTDSRKREAIRDVLLKISDALKFRYAGVAFSADMFGYAFLNGSEAGIGQYLDDFVGFGFIISPMAYPSHYDCNAFGAPDPNKIPYTVYHETLIGGMRFLREKGYPSPQIRPWLQGFTIKNIFGCGIGDNGKGKRGKTGTITEYEHNRARFREQIRALEDLGIESWMVWHAGARYSKELFDKK